MESLNDYLSKSFNRLSSNDISETNNFLNYTNFKKFILPCLAANSHIFILGI